MSRLPPTIKVGDVVIDESIYPRDHIQASHVVRLMEAMTAGTTLPPLAVERKTKRSIDGAHTTLAYRKLYGSDFAAPVVWVGPFATNEDAVEEASERNRHHGLPFSESDRARIVYLLRQGGRDRPAIAAVLQISETRVQRLETRIAYQPAIPTPTGQTTLIFEGQPQEAPQDSDDREQEEHANDIAEDMQEEHEDGVQEANTTASGTTSQVIPLKPDTRHWNGVVVEDQRTVDALRGSPGSGYKSAITQLARAIRTGILNQDDDVLMGMLEDLRDALTEYLA